MPDKSLTYRLKADVTGFRASLAQASASMGQFADKATATTKEGEKFRKGLTSVGNAAGAVAVATGAGLGAAVLAAANFDQAMSQVKAATQESARNMELLRKAALQAGEDTVYSASEAAGAIEELSKAGVSTKDILGGGLDGALSLAAAGNMEVKEAAETAARALTTFNLKGEKSGHVADLLAAGAGKAQGEVHDLSEALKQAGLVAAQSDFSMEETTAVLSAFASKGLLGSDAGTSLKTFMLNLVPSTKAAFDALQAYNLASYDAKNAGKILAEQGLEPTKKGYEGTYEAVEKYLLAQGVAKKGTVALADAVEEYMIQQGIMRTGFTKANGEFKSFAGIAGELREKLDELSAPERQAALKKIFGTDAVRAANALYDEGQKGIEQWTKKVDDAGYAAKTAADRTDNLKGDLERLSGSLETALIGTGSGAQGPLRDLVQGLEGVVDAYNDLPPTAKNAVGKMLAYTTAIGGGLFVFSRTVSAISDTRQAFENLGWAAKDSSRKMVAMRGGAAIAGGALFALRNEIGETHEVAGQLAGVLGGGLVGFGVAGPWGAAAGAVAGLAWELKKAHDAMEDGEDQAIDYAASLDEVTGAATRATREQAVQQLQQSGALGTARSFGLATRDVVSASLGDPAAIKRVNGVLDEYAKKNMESALAVASLRNQMGIVRHDFEKQVDATNEARDATNTWKDALAGVRPKVFTEIKALGFDLTMEQVNQLDKKFDLTARERRIIIRETGAREVGKKVDELERKGKELEEDPAVLVLKAMTRDAFRDVSTFAGYIKELTRKPYEVRFTTSGPDGLGGLLRGNLPRVKRAAGGAVYGAGTGTSDSIPAWLSNGEYVLKAAAVQKYGISLLDQMNSMRFANGGMVTRSAQVAQAASGPSSLNLSDAAVARLAGAVLNARPLYGNVTVYGDGSFERHARGRRVSLGGGD